MYYELLSLARTKEEAKTLISELDSVSEALYKNRPEEIEDVLTKKVRAKVAEVLRQDFAKGFNREKYISEIKEALKKYKVISLTLSFEPREGTLVKLSAWVKKNLGEEILLDISKDEKIVGGAVIISEGNFRDFSLRKKIKEYVSSQKSQISTQISQ